MLKSFSNKLFSEGDYSSINIVLKAFISVINKPITLLFNNRKIVHLEYLAMTLSILF